MGHNMMMRVNAVLVQRCGFHLPKKLGFVQREIFPIYKLVFQYLLDPFAICNEDRYTKHFLAFLSFMPTKRKDATVLYTKRTLGGEVYPMHMSHRSMMEREGRHMIRKSQKTPPPMLLSQHEISLARPCQEKKNKMA